MASIERPELGEDDRHHLERVLRVRAGEEITVSDGAGAWRICRFGASLEPVGDIRHVDRPAPGVTIAFAPVKGERPEWAVQKLTELGVDAIVPLIAHRSVVRWDAGHPAPVTRWRRVAREAAMQSRRVWLPEVSEPMAFEAAATRADAVLADPSGDPPVLEGDVVVLVGPEGGWEAAERARGRSLVSLGPNVLRTETAAVAAGALFCALRAGIVRSRDEREQ